MREHGSRRECRRWSHSFLLLLWIGCVFGVRSKSLSRVTVPGWRREKQKARASLETTPSPPLFATTSSTTHGFFGVRRKNVIPNRELFDTSERPLFYSKTKCKRDDDQTRWNYRNVCVMLQLRSTCTLFLHLSNAEGGGIFPSPGEPAASSVVSSVPSAADAFVHEPLVADEHRSFPFFESSPDDDRVVVWVRHADDAIVHLARHHAWRFLRPFRRARKIVMVEDVLALCEAFEFGTVEAGGVFEIGDDICVG